MKIIFLLMLTMITGYSSFSQANEEREVLLAINTLFDGMRLGDSSKVHSVFASRIAMATVSRNKAGITILTQDGSLDAFLKAVGTPHTEALTEEIWNVKIQIDGNLAQAWCDYAFYVGHTFSHCGVDAFQLFKDDAGWKIFHLADTRRKTPCQVPVEIQSKHKK